MGAIIKPYNTAHVVDGRLVESKAFVVLGEDGLVVGGPVKDEEEAKELRARANHEALVASWVRSENPSISDRALKGKVNLIVSYMAWHAKYEAGECEPAEETPAGTPGKDEPTFDEKEEF